MSVRKALFFLLLSSGCHAAVITVGPGGDEVSIQDAVDSAIATMADDEIRIAAGTFMERLAIQPVTDETLTISGGWNATFDAQTGMSTVDGSASGRVVDLFAGGSNEVHFSRLSITNGLDDRGAGLSLTLIDSSVVTFTDCAIVDNVAQDDRADGGGMIASLSGMSSLTLLRTNVSNNAVECSGTVDCREGGIGIGVNTSASLVIRNSTFIGNSVTIASGSGFSGGVGINGFDATTSVVFEDNLLEGNTVESTSSGGLATGLTLLTSGEATLRRNTLINNRGIASNPGIYSQALVSIFGTEVATISDSLIADSNTRGFSAFIGGSTPTLYLTNLTIADHDETGLRISDNSTSGMAFVSNTIAVDNGTSPSLDPGVVEATNLFAGSLLFENPASGNYRLREGSAAIDSGTASPPGGLGMSDLDGEARISGIGVDIGAYEWITDVLFTNGFEIP